MTAPVVRIGTRGSKLALLQTDFVVTALQETFPNLHIEVITITTRGDKVQNVPIRALGQGQKGVFAKELEEALLTNEIDLAVHSCKDLAMVLPDGLLLAGCLERDDPRDALVLPQHANAPQRTNPLDSLPHGAHIGTGSARRGAQLRALRSDLQISDIRGNVDTRLRKLDAGEYDAIILACAGLRRMGWDTRISYALEPDVVLCDAGQAAIAVETRADATAINAYVRAISHHPTFTAILAERAFSRALHGGCHAAVGAFAEIYQDTLRLQGLLGTRDGSIILRDEQQGLAADPESIGLALAEGVLQRGGAEILQREEEAESASPAA